MSQELPEDLPKNPISKNLNFSLQEPVELNGASITAKIPILTKKRQLQTKARTKSKEAKKESHPYVNMNVDTKGSKDLRDIMNSTMNSSFMGSDKPLA